MDPNKPNCAVCPHTGGALRKVTDFGKCFWHNPDEMHPAEKKAQEEAEAREAERKAAAAAGRATGTQVGGRNDRMAEAEDVPVGLGWETQRSSSGHAVCARRPSRSPSSRLGCILLLMLPAVRGHVWRGRQWPRQRPGRERAAHHEGSAPDEHEPGRVADHQAVRRACYLGKQHTGGER